MKKIIKLTESDLHRIIKKSVNKTLNENTPHFSDSVDSCLEKMDAIFCNETIIAKFMRMAYEFEETIRTNRNDLSNDQLSQLYELDNKVAYVAFGLTEIRDSIADLMHAHSVEYYQRFGD